jgi:hypothetical protein
MVSKFELAILVSIFHMNEVSYIELLANYKYWKSTRQGQIIRAVWMFAKKL